MIKTKNNNNESNLKGASDIHQFKPLENILKMVGLTTSNEEEEEVSYLKGASTTTTTTTTTNNNIPLCDKTKSLINLKKLFGLI